MPRYESKPWPRFSRSSLSVAVGGGLPASDPQGNLFISPLGQFNSEVLSVLHAGVDTVRQLYSGLLRPVVLAEIQYLYDAGHGQILFVGGQRFVVSSGRAGGYKFILRNADLGLHILLKSNFVGEDLNGSHLKFELSPHFLVERGADEVQADLDRWAQEFLTQVVPVGVAVHLACDVQGIEVPDNFDQCLITRAKCSKRSGISSMEIEGLRDISTVYGKAQSFLWGTVSNIQFAVYRKDIEAEGLDKMHFWREKWKLATKESTFPESCYDPEKPVWRFEARFHHGVIHEFANGMGKKFNTFKDIAEHLTGLWRYALNNFRWDQTTTYIRPEWQFLMESVFFSHDPPSLEYVRAKKKPGEFNARQVAIALGNLTSLYAHQRYDKQYAFKCLVASGIYEAVLNYYRFRHFRGQKISMGDLSAYVFREFSNMLERKILLGAAA